jgi:hypothetical protein
VAFLTKCQRQPCAVHLLRDVEKLHLRVGTLRVQLQLTLFGEQCSMLCACRHHSCFQQIMLQAAAPCWLRCAHMWPVFGLICSACVCPTCNPGR